MQRYSLLRFPPNILRKNFKNYRIFDLYQGKWGVSVVFYQLLGKRREKDLEVEEGKLLCSEVMFRVNGRETVDGKLLEGQCRIAKHTD